MIAQGNEIVASEIIMLNNQKINVYIIKIKNTRNASWNNRLIVKASFVKENKKDVEIFNLKKKIQELESQLERGNKK